MINLIKKLTLISLLSIYLPLNATETIYENAEDGSTDRWFIYDESPAGATINNTYDAQNNSRVITLQGEGTSNGYIVGGWQGDDLAWGNRHETLLSMDLKFNEYYRIYVVLETTKGRRYLYYSSQDSDRGIVDTRYIHLGLGENHMDGQWYTESRDLVADLHRYEPDNTIIEINGVMFRGSGSIDNVKLSDGVPVYEQINYEDAEDGDTIPWAIYDASPAGATITNIYDATSNSRVINLQGEGTRNGYVVGGWIGDANAWHELNRKRLSFKVNYNSHLKFYVITETTKGRRYMYYSTVSEDRGILSTRFIHHGLGTTILDGEWHYISRDIEADLLEFEPDNHLISIEGMQIRGSGMIDNVILSQGLPTLATTVYEDVENGASNQWEIAQDTGSASINVVSPSFDGSNACLNLRATGGSTQNVYKLPMYSAVQTILEIDVGGFDGINQPHYLLGVYANTLQGVRIMYWDSFNTHNNNPPRKNVLGNNTFLIYPSPIELVRGYGYAPQDQVETFRVDLNRQLQLLEPDNRIISVTDFIAGGGFLDNIRLSSQ